MPVRSGASDGNRRAVHFFDLWFVVGGMTVFTDRDKNINSFEWVGSVELIVTPWSWAVGVVGFVFLGLCCPSFQCRLKKTTRPVHHVPSRVCDLSFLPSRRVYRDRSTWLSSREVFAEVGSDRMQTYSC